MDREAALRKELDRLDKLFRQADTAVDQKFDKMNVLATNFKTYYETNEKASRGKTLDDRKIDRSTLLPLLDISKAIADFKYKLITATATWQSGIPMNIGEQLALRRML